MRFTSALLAKTEPYIIDGITYTTFYTEVETLVSVGDYMYIFNGNYETNNANKVLFVDRNKIVLDILYSGENTYNNDSLSDFTKVFIVDSISKFKYENEDNNFGRDNLVGLKYSEENNAIFLSKIGAFNIDGVVLTTETNIVDKFFKSKLNPELTEPIINDRGSIFKNAESLKFNINGTSIGATISSIPNGYDKFIHMDIINSNSRIISIIEDNSDSQLLFYWIKSNNINSADTYTIEFNDIDNTKISYMSKMTNDKYTKLNPDKSNISIRNKTDIAYKMIDIETGTTTEESAYDVSGLNSAIIMGFDDSNASNSYRFCGFYSSDNKTLTPGSDYANTLGAIVGSPAVNVNGFTAGTASPFFVLSNNDAADTPNNYMYVDGTLVNLIPAYAYFRGMGIMSKAIVNEISLSEYDVNDFQIAISGRNTESPGEDIDIGGIYIYSYGGDYRLSEDTIGNAYMGNALYLYKGIEADDAACDISLYDPFESVRDTIDFDKFYNVYDINFIGVKEKNITYGGDSVKELFCNYNILTEDGSYNLYVTFYAQYLKNKYKSIESAFNNSDSNYRNNYLFIVEETETENENINTVSSVLNYNNNFDIIPEYINLEVLVGSIYNNNIATSYNIRDTTTPPLFNYQGQEIVSVSAIDNGNITVFGTAEKSVRLGIDLGTYSYSTGVYIYDNDYGDFVFNITDDSTVTTGDVLPTNSINFIKLDAADNSSYKRIWVGTDDGLYLYEYFLTVKYDMYYSVDFDNNIIPVSNSIISNNRLYIMEEFDYDGITFQKNKIYSYNNKLKSWEIDTTYDKPYISNTYIKNAHLESNITISNAILGNNETTIQWNGGTFNHGILYNILWNTGSMNSTKTNPLYKADINIDGDVNTTLDKQYNLGYGYNYIINSTILESSNIENGNFINCTFGLNNTQNTLWNIYTEADNVFNNINFTKGNIKNSILNILNIDNTNIVNSYINKSVISNSIITNSEIIGSKINSGIYDNTGQINVVDYDIQKSVSETDTNINLIIKYKFYIDEDNYKNSAFNNWYSFNNILVGTNTDNNIFDNIYHTRASEDTQIQNGFYRYITYNLNKVADYIYDSNSIKTYKYENLNTHISFKTKEENSYSTNVTLDSDIANRYFVETVVTGKGKYSIDLEFSYSVIKGSDISTFSDLLDEMDEYKRVNIDSINGARIQNRFIKNSWVNGGEIIGGNLSSLDELSAYEYMDFVSRSSSDFNLYLTDYDRDIRYDYLFEENDILYGNNFVLETPLKNINLLITDIIPAQIVAYTDSALVGTTFSQYNNININFSLNRLDGIDNTLIIKNSKINKNSMRNLSIFDSKLLNIEIGESDNVNIKGGVLISSYVFDTDTTLDTTKIYRSNVEANIINTTFFNSSIMNSTITDSIIYDSKYVDNDSLIPRNMDNILYNSTYNAYVPQIFSCIIENSTISDSFIRLTTINSGIISDSEALDITMNNGTFGYKNANITNNIIRSGVFNGGFFDGGIIGDNENYIPIFNNIYNNDTTIPYQKKVFIWNYGVFNDGLFTDSKSQVSLWMSGIFNGGEINGSVIWYNGRFNNGKFRSTYGSFMPTVFDRIYMFNGAYVEESDRIYAQKSLIAADLTNLDIYSYGSHGDDQDKYQVNTGTLMMNSNDDKLYFLSYNTIGNNAYDVNALINKGGYLEYAIRNNVDINIIFKDVDKEPNHPVYNKKSIGTIAPIQTEEHRIYNGTTYIEQNTFLASTIPGTSLTYESIYAWRGGIMNGGEFGEPNNNSGFNPSWEDGIMYNGKFYGKVWANGKLVRGEFIGSGSNITDNTNNLTVSNFNPKNVSDKYIGLFSQIGVNNNNIANKTNYKNILNNHKWFGLWNDGEVVYNINQISDTTNNSLEQTETYVKDKYNKERLNRAIFKNTLWNNGTFNNSDAIFINSIFLSGSFDSGNFINSAFNPYIERYDFKSHNYLDRVYSFDLDRENTIWNNGILTNSMFFMSIWNNGIFDSGHMIGGVFKSGLANYISTYNTIWEDGRHRNGNWNGSSFPIKNVYDVPYIPNPFQYLGQTFKDKEYIEPVTDIVAINSDYLKTPQIHIWNTLDSTVSINSVDLSGYAISSSLYTTSDSNTNYNIFLSDNSPTNGDLANGIFSINLDVNTTSIGTDDDESIPVPYLLSTSVNNRFATGTYQLSLYNSVSPNILNLFNTLPGSSIILRANVYNATNNTLLSTVNIGTVNTNSNPAPLFNFIVPPDREYQLLIRVVGTLTNTMNFRVNTFLSVEAATGTLVYNDDNNTLNGEIFMEYVGGTPSIFTGDLDTITFSGMYSDTYGATISYNGIKIDNTINITTVSNSEAGIYTQFGNGAFLNGIFENGVWNSGYRGGDYGKYIATGTSSVIMDYDGTPYYLIPDPIYTDQGISRTYKPLVFNKIETFYKTSNTTNTWRIVLVSGLPVTNNAFDVVTNPYLNSKIVKAGDNISIGNIAALDINGNRKLLKGIYKVIKTIGENRIVVEYNGNFPIEAFIIDSPRHLISVTKNIWFNGAFLNGYFNGVFNNGFIRGNRETTKLENVNIIEADIKGGHIVGATASFNDTYTDSFVANGLALSPDFIENGIYDSNYHTTLIQNMRFEDDVELSTFEMTSPTGLSVFGDSITDSKGFTYSGTTSSNAVKYIYNTDLDLVYEPEFFTSIFNQNIYNSHIVNQSRIGDGKTTKMYNVPAGNITYDVLSSTSIFNYSLNPTNSNSIETFILSLGSKYNVYNSLFDINFSKSPNNSVESDVPSVYNIIEAAEYGLTKKTIDLNDKSGSFTGTIPGVNTYNEFNIEVSEEFVYLMDIVGGVGGTYSGSVTGSTFSSFVLTGDNQFTTRGRYHVVEVDTAFLDNESFLNPYNSSTTFTVDTDYDYTSTKLPKLTINQDYNTLYEYRNSGSIDGYLSSYDNDFIPYIDGSKIGEINRYGNSLGRATLKTFIYNNFGGYRDSVRLFEKDFALDDIPSLTSVYTIKSPVYYSMKHVESDAIPFFNYRDFNSDEWNMFENQIESRSIDTRVKTPIYAVSVPIKQEDTNFVLIDNISFIGGNVINSQFEVGTDVFIIENPNSNSNSPGNANTGLSDTIESSGNIDNGFLDSILGS